MALPLTSSSRWRIVRSADGGAASPKLSPNSGAGRRRRCIEQNKINRQDHPVVIEPSALAIEPFDERLHEDYERGEPLWTRQRRRRTPRQPPSSSASSTTSHPKFDNASRSAAINPKQVHSPEERTDRYVARRTSTFEPACRKLTARSKKCDDVHVDVASKDEDRRERECTRTEGA